MPDEDQIPLDESLVDTEVDSEIGLLDDEVDPYKEEEEEDETYLNLSVMREMDPYGEFNEA